MPVENRSATVRTIELFEAEVPLSGIAQAAMAESDNGLGMALAAEDPWTAADFLFVKVVDEDGLEGWGEAYVWLPESAVSNRGMASVIRDHLGRYVLGAHPTDVRAVAARMDRNIPRNEMAKGVLDVALHDLAARQVDRPVHDLIGGAAVDRIPLCALVPMGSPEFVAEICRGYVDAGYRSLRIKLGASPREDLAVVTAIRDAVGWDVRIRCDYNQAYDAPSAVRALRLLEPFDVDGAEQPLPIGDLLGMRWVQERTAVPLFLHEGFFSLSEMTAAIELGAIGALGVNAERPGGITAALRAIDYASTRGLGTIIHNQPLGIRTAVHAHLAVARWDQLGHSPELAGDVMFEEHLTTSRYQVLDEVRSIAELSDLLSDRARTTPETDALFGFQLDGQLLAERRLPTAAELDAATGGRQVVLLCRDGHHAVGSTAALHTAGLGDPAAPPAGGHIAVDATGSPSGLVGERAVEPLMALMPELTIEGLAAATESWADRLLGEGITSISAMCQTTAEGPAGPAGELEAIGWSVLSGGLPFDIQTILITPDPAEALAMFTTGASFARGTEDEVGAIRPGLRADVVVLDADPTDPATDLDAVKVLATTVAGRNHSVS